MSKDDYVTEYSIIERARKIADRQRQLLDELDQILDEAEALQNKETPRQ